MIFFGTNHKTANGTTVNGVECPNCGHSEFQTFGIQRYFHIYWIPTIPVGRTAGMECTHCRLALVDDEIPAAMADRVTAAAFAGRSRLPMFAGLIIIAMLVVYGTYTASGVETRHEAVLEQPAAGDYYVVDLTKTDAEADADMPYTIWRVSSVGGDAVHFDESRFVYEYWSDASKDVRYGTAATEMDTEGDGFSVDVDQLAAWRDAGAFKRALRLVD